MRLIAELRRTLSDWDTALVTYSQESFIDQYTEEQRTYRITSKAKYFNPKMNGASLHGDCLDGVDLGVRLDLIYWKVEKVRIENYSQRFKDAMDEAEESYNESKRWNEEARVERKKKWLDDVISQ